MSSAGICLSDAGTHRFNNFHFHSTLSGTKQKGYKWLKYSWHSRFKPPTACHMFLIIMCALRLFNQLNCALFKHYFMICLHIVGNIIPSLTVFFVTKGSVALYYRCAFDVFRSGVFWLGGHNNIVYSYLCISKSTGRFETFICSQNCLCIISAGSHLPQIEYTHLPHEHTHRHTYMNSHVHVPFCLPHQIASTYT